MREERDAEATDDAATEREGGVPDSSALDASEGDGDGDREDAGADAGNADGAVADCRYRAIHVAPADQVVLVLDGSTSMTMPMGETGLSYWSALHEALFGPEGAVDKLQDQTRIGMAIYGTTPTCPLPLGLLAPAPAQAAAIEASFPSVPPGIFTPVPEAIAALRELLVSNAADTTLVLLTDGDPNGCLVDPVAIPATSWPETELAILGAVDEGFAVRVVSLHSSVFPVELQRAANLGAGLAADASPGAVLGMATDVATLRAALEAALAPRSVCKLHLDVSVDTARACEGSVALDGVTLPCASDDGWTLEDATSIALHGEACAAFEADRTSAIDVSFPCAAIHLESGECRGHADCSAGAPICEDERCVECSDATDCLEGELCEEGDCSSPCGARGTCVAQTPYCDGSTMSCAVCLADAHCGTGLHCEPNNKTCVTCTEHDHCGNETPICASDTHECVGCQSEADCNDDTPLCSTAGTCVECDVPADCSELTPVCDSTLKRCVECELHTDCLSTEYCAEGVCTLKPFCDPFECPFCLIAEKCCRDDGQCGCVAGSRCE